MYQQQQHKSTINFCQNSRCGKNQDRVFGKQKVKQQKSLCAVIRVPLTHLNVNQVADTNLMDLTNKQVNQDTNVYGLCDKQLACTTCSVEIQTMYDKLKQPSEDEMDILLTLPKYKDKCTRMACQIVVTPELDGMVVRVPNKRIQ